MQISKLPGLRVELLLRLLKFSFYGFAVFRGLLSVLLQPFYRFIPGLKQDGCFGKRFLFRRLAFGDASQLFVVLCQLLTVRRQLLLAGIQCRLELRELLGFFVLRAGQLRDLRFQRLDALLAGFELLLGFGKRFLFRRLAFGNACQLFVVLCQ